ncbi:LysR family transcriptional regulator [Novosphingobium terrae]|uniref:LysR family transcriptional regulator n=1 Tax=Novosphingobium terrae TaxID=2726189 RepID=UPI0019812973|nr:LysR family transcriptional regulator [Novosphingobium terrae]
MSGETQALLSLKQVRAVVAVAGNASLARASESLNISQSSLSRIIHDSEGTLGHGLFQRGWNGMEPTSAGAIVIQYCLRMAGAIAEAQDRLLAAGWRLRDLAYHLTWPMLEVVEAVRVTGNVSQAAAVLGMPQPNVSRVLAQMTATLGCHPFIRHAKGMAATPAAIILCDLREKLRAEALQLPAALAALSGMLVGRIAVGVLPFSEQDIVVETFATLLRDHPHIRLQAVTGSYGALSEALRRGEIDVMIGPLRGASLSAHLEERVLLEEVLTFIARLGHPLACGPVSLDDLVKEGLVVGPYGTPTRQFFETLLLERNLPPPARICEMVTFPLAERMVMESEAIGLLTYSPRKRFLAAQLLAIIEADLPESRRAIGLTTLKGKPFTAAQQVFMTAITGVLP